MLRVIGAGVTLLFITASSLAYAQTPSTGTAESASAADMAGLTDARIEITKAALQLTADQEKYWPAVEDAIRNRAKNRQARIGKAAERMSQMSEKNPIEGLRDRNPVDFMQRRADALAQRSADLKKLADAWQPLYQTLTPDQKRRLALLTIFVIREVRSALDQRRASSEYDDEE
jgi:LTXXQ motif family protein